MNSANQQNNSYMYGVYPTVLRIHNLNYIILVLEHMDGYFKVPYDVFANTYEPNLPQKSGRHYILRFKGFVLHGLDNYQLNIKNHYIQL